MPSWCSVRPSRSGTRTIAFLAAAVALEIASGTSRALPWPKPARPLPSPTTTSAAKPKRLPPFTVLETRLMWTSFSISSSPPSSSPPRPRPRSSRRPRPPPPSRSPPPPRRRGAARRGRRGRDGALAASGAARRLRAALGRRRGRLGALGVGFVSHHQNSNPPSRAASASALTRPWNRKPPRSNTTLGDAGRLGALGDLLADLLRGSDGRAGLGRARPSRASRRRRRCGPRRRR